MKTISGLSEIRAERYRSRQLLGFRHRAFRYKTRFLFGTVLSGPVSKAKMTDVSVACFCEIAVLNRGWTDATTWPSGLWVKALRRSTTLVAGVGV
jgi:hypothetical protein